MAAEEKAPVSVLGLGPMGRAIAEAFLAEGHPVTVWNRSPGKADALVAKGASAAATPAEAAAASPLVVTVLLDHASVHEVLDPVGEVLNGRTLVDLTTGSPEEGRELSAWAERQGATGFLDGGVMAVPSLIGGPHAFILYSGSREAFDTHESALAAAGAARYVGADAGLAALYDLALLSGMYGMFAGFLHALAIVDTAEVPASGFTAELLLPWLQAMLEGLPEMAQRIDSGDYTEPESSLAMQTSGVGLVDFSASLGISAEPAAPMEELMRRRAAQGRGADDLASVFELIRHPERSRG